MKRGTLLTFLEAVIPAGNTYFIRDGCVMRETPDGARALFAAPPAFLRLLTADTLRIAGSVLLIGLLIVHFVKEKLES